jgi:hypothetical protein
MQYDQLWSLRHSCQIETFQAITAAMIARTIKTAPNTERLLFMRADPDLLAVLGDESLDVIGRVDGSKSRSASFATEQFLELISV